MLLSFRPATLGQVSHTSCTTLGVMGLWVIHGMLYRYRGIPSASSAALRK